MRIWQSTYDGPMESVKNTPRRNSEEPDTVMFSILAHEWPDVRRHLEFRLARHGGAPA